MLLQEIRNRILSAQKNLKLINPGVKCYLVVSINGFQFMPGDLTPGNLKLVDLLKHPRIFLPDQDLENLVQLSNKILQLKNAKPERPENGKLIRDLFTDFAPAIETIELYESQCELRFYSLDMEKIQELKAHPIVKGIGRTDGSEASINVVIG